MGWFVLLDLGYDGQMVIKTEEEEEARRGFKEDCEENRQGGNSGVALVEGQVVEEIEFNWCD